MYSAGPEAATLCSIDLIRDANAFSESIHAASRKETPYRYWLLRNCITDNSIDEVLQLPFVAPELDGVSGKRELHNQTRTYFDVEKISKYSICSRVAKIFQSNEIARVVQNFFGAPIAGCYLRIEHAQDVGGFWLEPHTDLGVKKFTMVLYLSKNPEHAELGTDIYDADKNLVGRAPFLSNSALVFVPSAVTDHGFERRQIIGVRTSLIINYVTSEWRAREQLAFPDTPLLG